MSYKAKDELLKDGTLEQRGSHFQKNWIRILRNIIRLTGMQVPKKIKHILINNYNRNRNRLWQSGTNLSRVPTWEKVDRARVESSLHKNEINERSSRGYVGLFTSGRPMNTRQAIIPAKFLVTYKIEGIQRKFNGSLWERGWLRTRATHARHSACETPEDDTGTNIERWSILTEHECKTEWC